MTTYWNKCSNINQDPPWTLVYFEIKGYAAIASRNFSAGDPLFPNILTNILNVCLQVN
jgi:hypothetical protein